MKFALFWIVLAGLICLAERRWIYFPFAIASLLFLTGLMFLFVGKPFNSALLATILAFLISGASAVKHHHSGLKLAISDLALTFSGTIPFMLKQYRLTAIVSLSCAALLISSAVLVLLTGDSAQYSFTYRLIVLIFVMLLIAAAYRLYGGANYFRQHLTDRAGFLSSFIASFLDFKSWWRTTGLRFIDIANEPLETSEPSRKDSSDMPGVQRPDIFIVQHESVFDPRTFGLPVNNDLEAFFSPPNAQSGTLQVEIYGGGSWQTEFSMLTGLSSRSFGPDSYFLFKKGAGRFHHTLPDYLSELGYQTTLVAACRRNFLDYDRFYASIGVDDRVFIEDLPVPFDIARFEETSSDAMFMQAARTIVGERNEEDSSPRLFILLTNFNHGPHSVKQVSPASFESERLFARNSLPDDQYEEYFVRLAETAESWKGFTAEYSSRFPNRNAVAVRYGDHQPVMTRRIETALKLPESNSRHLKTFYAIEGINRELQPTSTSTGSDLDIAFLGTVALQATGLPLDPIYSERIKLMAECGSDYFACDSARKLKFHRVLVELGLVDCKAS
ncbi:MAG: sulfatase-like hydrolase/transferase [Rhizobiaceae bacterium]